MREALDDLARLRVIVHHMIGGVVGTEMILERLLRMADSDVIVFLVVGEEGRLEQEFQIHHIVDDDGKLPPVGGAPAPGPDAAHFLVVS